MNKSKAKGTRAETRVSKYLNSHGIEARRKPLAGSSDEGDLFIRTKHQDYAAEVKAGKQTASPSRSQISEWCKQALVEAEHAKASPMLIVVRYNRPLKDADVYIPIDEVRRFHFYLEDWVDSQV